MRIIISPAKKMRVDTDSFDCRELPVFLDRTETLMNWIVLIVLLLLVFTAGCSASGPAAGTETSSPGFHQISQEEAKEMMAKDDGHVVVDVRRQDEYDAGHIPGAILVPNESIGCDSPEALPDYDQIILIYCRTGNRSKQAAQKLASMGYTNIYEFGGITTWTGDVVTD